MLEMAGNEAGQTDLPGWRLHTSPEDVPPSGMEGRCLGQGGQPARPGPGPIGAPPVVAAVVEMRGNRRNGIDPPQGEGVIARTSWRSSKHPAEGGTGERDPRDERGGPGHPGNRRGPGDSREHGPPVLELARGHEAEAEAPPGFQVGGGLERWASPASQGSGGTGLPLTARPSVDTCSRKAANVCGTSRS